MGLRIFGGFEVVGHGIIGHYRPSVGHWGREVHAGAQGPPTGRHLRCTQRRLTLRSEIA
jgi:hypothetical protein